MRFAALPERTYSFEIAGENPCGAASQDKRARTIERRSAGGKLDAPLLALCALSPSGMNIRA